jgi:hypothetical protein
LPLLVLAVAAGLLAGCASTHDRDLPEVMLWAWERPEDLRFIDPARVGVAFLVATLEIGQSVEVAPRRQSLRVPDRTRLMGVVRLQTTPGGPSADRHHLEEVLAHILFFVQDQQLSALQIDFDARVSERSFYRDLLEALRVRLPQDCFLSMTALASWCISDTWIVDLPVDEAVPMMFRMGPEASSAVAHFMHTKSFRVALANRSLGMSTDEPWFVPPQGRRLYLFSPDPWTSETLARFQATAGRGGL